MALAVGPATPAAAQDDVLEEVTVTGSRIRRQDFTANSPIQTVDEQLFDETTSIGVETILNRLPQFVPAVTQFTTTVGASTVSLRGLGPNRNLILINGRRAMPVNATMVVDTNSIPSAAIQSVEVISGGASAVYGADAVVDALFDQVNPMAGSGITSVGAIAGAGGVSSNVESVRYLVNRNSGTLYTGLMNANGRNGSYRYEGPYIDDHDGNFPGLPFRVLQPDGTIKENNFWQWASTPLERLSGFADGHFDVADDVRITAQAMVTRTETATSLGLTADNITIWGAPIPFGNEIYRSNDNLHLNVPDSLIDVNGNGIADAGDMTNSAYTIGGRFNVECDAQPTAAMPWLDGMPGCTESEAWPTTPEIWNLFSTRPDPEMDLWANRPPDYLRDAIGAARSSLNTLTTMNFSLGAEGELSSGNDFWDVTFSTGRTDNIIIQRGSSRISTDRAMMSFPNYGRNAIFDPNPFVAGFAESIPVCTSGFPIIDTRKLSEDCATMFSPDLKNTNQVTQSILEANLVGDLIEMPAGPLAYAAGYTYRENSYVFEPDNLSDNQNLVDPIAGLFPNEDSSGEFDVSEIYGELLIPIVSNGPTGIQHFNIELGARVSDWSIPQVSSLTTYKALIDWAITPRYRVRGGFNRAFRAPNLGELFIGRTQIFGGGGTVFGDHCSQNQNSPSSYGATPAANASAAQNAQTLAICRALMGDSGAFEYYDARPLADQPDGGGLGIRNSFGQPNLSEEQADTFTLGVVMDFHDNFTLTVDYYKIEIEEMIALETADSTYERCLSMAFNPTGDANSRACHQIFRRPSTGNAANIDSSFTNEGRAVMAGVDFQLNWTKELANGGFAMNTVANYNLESTTQDRPALAERDHSGYNSCALQIQCQRYDYRVFTTFSYFTGPWTVSLRHQYWPSLDDADCRANRMAKDCMYDGFPSYGLFALTAGYTFQDRYRVNLGVENLLDDVPPCRAYDPDANGGRFARDCNRGSGSAVYDPLGRRFFVSLSMEF
ncbi:TonB-dependent receptor domain-containing protein [Candidatus Rariloculus sp.]|uniref:TonB-dependent receptor domain-containing protein n=1 Tax=Candidatus Rariloculus sp. TaxID=3101265 RepID=UPI003D0EF863